MEILRVRHAPKSRVLLVHFRPFPPRPRTTVKATLITPTMPIRHLPSPAAPLRRWLRVAAWCVLATVLGGTGLMGLAHASAPPPPLATSLDQPLIQQANEWAQKNLSPDDLPDGDQPLRPEIELGQLDSRLQLAPCARVEPYLPRGARLWGRSRIGLRCVEGPRRWNVFLPITVKVWGPAWVVQRPIAPGAVLTAGDVAPGEVDWAEHPAPVLVREADWQGVTAARGLLPGQVLRQNMVRPVQVFKAGTEVKVQVKHAGFQLSATGRAMGHGFLGQAVRVKMPNGRVVSGRVRRDHSVGVEM